MNLKLIFKYIKNIFLEKKKNYKRDVNPHIYEKYKNKTLVNLGSGRFDYKYWKCVDAYSSHYYPDGFPDDYYNVNFNEDNFVLPFDNNSVDIFYNSHCIEHLPNKSIKTLFKQIYDKLKHGSLVRITCPNIDLAIEALKNFNKVFFDIGNRYPDLNIFQLYFQEWQDPLHENFNNFELLKKFLKSNLGESELDELFKVKNIDKVNGHINWMNEDKVIKFLIEAGFDQKNIFVRHVSQSKSELFLDNTVFEKNYSNMSLYIEATK
jgi:predicted SAM-dependent methyltransferase